MDWALTGEINALLNAGQNSHCMLNRWINGQMGICVNSKGQSEMELFIFRFARSWNIKILLVQIHSITLKQLKLRPIYMRPDKNLRHRRAEVKLRFKWNHLGEICMIKCINAMHCMTFLRQTQIQSDLLDEESWRGRNLHRDGNLLKHRKCESIILWIRHLRGLGSLDTKCKSGPH